MASTIQVKVEDDLKMKADALFKDLGTDTSSAIRMFLIQAVMREGIPFEIKKNNNPYPLYSEDEMISMLDRAKEHAKEGQYRNADGMISDMREKYGL